MIGLAAFSLSGTTIAADVQWRACTLTGVQGKAECTEIGVLENRATSQGRKIALRVARLLPLTSDVASDPVFVLQGGPGQSAVSLAEFYGGKSWAATRMHRTIVLIDQRGTGGSNALDCPRAGRPDDPQSYLGEMFPEALIAACRKAVDSHADPSQYTTMAAVEDLEEVRARLGYAQIDLYGTSYGTRAALAYLERYPARVRALVLKGVIEPQSIAPSSFAEDTERALRLTIEDCAADPVCAGDYPNLDKSYRHLRAVLGRGAVTGEVSHEKGKVSVTLTRGVVAAALRTALQAVPYAAKVPRVMDAAGRDDFAPLAAFVLELRKASEGAVSTGLMLSVLCAEDVPQLSGESADDTFLGAYWERRARAGCRAWNVPAAATPFRTPATRDMPALMVSGHLDPATPPSHAEAAAKALPRAQQVVVRNGSHSFAGMAGCVDRLIAAFLADPGVALDTSCAAQIQRPPFVRPG